MNGAVVVVDDSHGVGVLGATGRGTVEHFGLLGEVDVITGTLGKALGGAAGGYVAASEEVCDVLAQRSRPQLFSNALPPTVACSALRAVELMLEQPELLQRLRENTRVFRELLAEAGYAPLDGEAAIVVDGTERARLGRGEFFGEVSIILGESPIADVVATRPLRCLVLAGPRVEPFLVDNPRVMYRMLQAQARRLRAANRWRS